MNRNLKSLPKIAAVVTFMVATAVLGFSGMTGSKRPDAKFAPAKVVSAADAVCSAPIFSIGKPLALADLAAAGNVKFELREVHFRNVILKDATEFELAYRIEMRMQLSESRFLTPVHSLACNESNHPSARAKRLSRTMIPVLGDLHLPSSRITVHDESSAESDLYNYSRISEITVSNGGYFSFNQNWAPYRQVRTVSQYMELLRNRAFYDRVELREMNDEFVGIYAEKTVGGEKAQLLIMLARTN